MKLIEKSAKILDRTLCDHCLGSQFAFLLTGYTNKQRGKIIRDNLAMLIDSNSIDSSKIDPSNFYGYTFRENKKFSKRIKKPEKCWLCNDLFDNLGKMIKDAEKKLKKKEFKTLLVGSILPDDVLNRQDKIWESIGIEWCEHLKNTINRIVGIGVCERLEKDVDFKRPDVNVFVNFQRKKVEIQINSFYVFGYYKKMKRGFPQSKWGTPGKYKTSIQEIISKPLMKAAKAKDNKFSGSGREDIDARNLGWRAFVVELLEPKKRKLDLKKIQKQINKSKKVNVKELKYSNKQTVVRIKTETGDKTYRVRVKLEKSIDKKNFRKLKELIGVINQKTPTRVLRRRADLVRKRRVKSLKYKQINKKTLELTIKTTAGLYIKELVSGDNGRSKPSVSEILGVKATPYDLDVIHIERPKSL